MLPVRSRMEAKEPRTGCQSMSQMQEPILGQATNEKQQAATREVVWQFCHYFVQYGIYSQTKRVS